MNIMVISVSGLIKHIIDEILIPRIRETKTSKDILQSYADFSKDENGRYKLAKITLSNIKGRLSYLSKADFEDFVCNVISTTIQNESNDYHRFLKSRNGFWASRFEVDSVNGFNDFHKTFSYFMFKAVQSESRTISYRFKHEVGVLEDNDGEQSIVSEMPDNNDSETKMQNMCGFEDKLEKMKVFALNFKEFDYIDKMIFSTWIKEKDNGNFTDSVNMLKSVFSPIIEELKVSGVAITSSALHFRWKRIRLFLKDFVLS